MWVKLKIKNNHPYSTPLSSLLHPPSPTTTPLSLPTSPPSAAFSRHKRCSKSCRLRWTNYLGPGIKRGNFTDQEEKMIIHLQALLGNRYVIK